MKNAVPLKLVPPDSGATAISIDASGYHAVYEEYLRGFDDVPVLQDAVRIPARRMQPDFRRGERRDARKEPRADPYSVREEHRAMLALFYAEYCRDVAPPTAGARRQAPKRRARKKKKR